MLSTLVLDQFQVPKGPSILSGGGQPSPFHAHPNLSTAFSDFPQCCYPLNLHSPRLEPSKFKLLLRHLGTLAKRGTAEGSEARARNPCGRLVAAYDTVWLFKSLEP